MTFACISTDFGIVVREAALLERNVTLVQLLQIFEVNAPLDRADGLISFGPHFGEEASDALCTHLEAAGLRFADDYFVFAPEVPDWCSFGVIASK